MEGLIQAPDHGVMWEQPPLTYPAAGRALAEALTDRGVQVERGTELVSVRDGPGGVRAVLWSPAKTEQAPFNFVVGCDGPASMGLASGRRRDRDRAHFSLLG
jgi:FAD binding domain